METVLDVKIKLYIHTDKRTVEKELGNLDELRWFMNDFFSSVQNEDPPGSSFAM